MDMKMPFSSSFGPAASRDELIVSSQAVYHRLLKLSPGSQILSYDILSVLASNEDGTADLAKSRDLRQLFRPDASNDLPMLAFIQSCDAVYKKLRYFRASVGNSSVIDKVLENMIDVFVGFVLGLAVLSFVGFNPWSLLVSLSTLLVTFAFAVGPSASKTFEVSQSADERDGNSSRGGNSSRPRSHSTPLIPPCRCISQGILLIVSRRYVGGKCFFVLFLSEIASAHHR
jgi:hypothetical protein